MRPEDLPLRFIGQGHSRPSGTAPAVPAVGQGRQQQAIRARYDNAQTTDDNRRNWQASDVLSAKAANSFQVRRQLRMRSRYEVANNPYLWGITNNNADDLIGAKGPTLKVLTADAAYNRRVERAWSEWADEVGLSEKLRTLKLAKTVDGEGFLVLKTVQDLEHKVKLYPVDIEADQVTSVAPATLLELWVDGLVLHPVTGRPTAYSVLKYHPGDYYFADFNPMKSDRIAARHVIHWFPKFRPGQVRGVPVFTPSLDLFAEGRAFRKAVLRKAQVSANLTAVLESEAPADLAGEDTGSPTRVPFDTVPIDAGTFTVLPYGDHLNAFAATEPATTYEMFIEKCLGEACRPLNYPLNLALGTSQKFNFSSAKLDHINYREGLTVERADCERTALDRLFAAWLEEAAVEGLLPASASMQTTPHEWHWPGYPTLDAAADTAADLAQLAGGTMTWQQFWAARGYDWRAIFAQQDAEGKLMESLGLDFGEPRKKSEKVDEDEPAGGKADAQRAAPFRASFNEKDHPRDGNGKFGEGGGGKEREARQDKEHEKLADKHAAEDATVEKARQKEDVAIDKAREKVDDREQARTDKAVERVNDKLERESVKREEKTETYKEWQKQVAEHGENSKEAGDAYDKHVGWVEKEDEKLQQQQDQVVKNGEESLEEWRQQQAEKHKAEDAALAEKRKAEDDEQLDRQSKEVDELDYQHGEEDEAADQAEAEEEERREKEAHAK